MADDLVNRLKDKAALGGATWNGDRLFETAAARITALQGQNRKLVEALTPSGDTKAAYMGEFSFLTISTDEDGNETAVKTYVPWTTIKEIMAAIRARAAIAEAEKGEG